MNFNFFVWKIVRIILLVLKPNPNISFTAIIGKGCVVPQSTIMREGSKVISHVVLGENVYVGRGVIIDGYVTIGRGCFIVSNANLSSCSFTGKEKANISNRLHSETDLPIVIGDYVAIDAYATIDKGVTVGDYAIVKSNSFVTKDVPAYAIVEGNPAEIVGYRIEKEAKKK